MRNRIYKNICNKRVSESILLTESRYYNKAKQMLIEDEFFDGDPSEFIQRIKTDVKILKTRKAEKFLVGVVRIYIEQFFTVSEFKDVNHDILGFLNDIIEFICEYDFIYKEFSPDLNGLRIEELFYTYLPLIDNKNAIERYKTSQLAKGLVRNKDYKIIAINSFQQANRFSLYTNWCICQSLDDYKAYVYGRQLYFCIKTDFEYIDEIKEDNYPKDEYGLSMIALVVNSKGDLVSSSTRWNDIEGSLSVIEIQNILGVDFYKTFYPNVRDIIDSKLSS